MMNNRLNAERIEFHSHCNTRLQLSIQVNDLTYPSNTDEGGRFRHPKLILSHTRVPSLISVLQVCTQKVYVTVTFPVYIL
jgi:hypothetical protein